MATWLVCESIDVQKSGFTQPLAALSVLVLAGCLTITAKQVLHWRNGGSLFNMPWP